MNLGPIQEKFGLQTSSLLSLIGANHLFAPSMVDGTFKIWHKKGLKCVDFRFVYNHFPSFSQLSEIFGITKHTFFLDFCK